MISISGSRLLENMRAGGAAKLFLCASMLLVIVGCNQWRMFHHDPLHTGQSSTDTSASVGTQKWKVADPKGVSSPSVISLDTVYVGTSSGNLLAVGFDGTVFWKFQTGNEIVAAPAVGLDGTIYIGSKDSNFYAVTNTGSQKWSFATGGEISSSATIGIDGTIYFGSDDTNLYALHPDGTLKWKFQTGGGVGGSPAIGFDGTIYVGSGDASLYALHPDGTLKWQTPLTSAVFFSSPAIFTRDGTIYIEESFGKLDAVAPDGTIKWTFPTGSENLITSPAVGSDGTIYFGGRKKTFYAINPEGTLKWQSFIGQDIDSSAAIGADGTIYFGTLCTPGLFDLGCSAPARLMALHPADGSFKWTFSSPDGTIASSPAIGPNGTIYIGTDAAHIPEPGPGHLFAIQ